MNKLDLLKSLNKKVKESEERKENIVKNKRYANWLSKYTEKNISFTDEDYIGKKIEDAENIILVKELYKKVREYAKKNYINPKENERENFYNIIYKSDHYEIGMIKGKMNKFYVERLDFYEDFKVPDVDLIRIENIIYEIETPHAQVINNKLRKISLELIRLKEKENVSDDKIMKNIQKTLKK